MESVSLNLDVLTSLYTAATQNALIGIVAIERIRVIDFVRLRSKRDSLMFDGQQLGGVMDRAIAIVVVANRAVEHVVTQNSIECLHLCDDAVADLVEMLIHRRPLVAQAVPGGRSLQPCTYRTSEQGRVEGGSRRGGLTRHYD